MILHSIPSMDSSHKDFVGDVANYPQLEYSMKEVRRAGEALAGGVVWDENHRPDVLRLFSVVNSYRDSHLLPMRSVRYSVIQRMRNLDMVGITAARPKRLPSLRRKLAQLPGKLDQIQDIAGCRAVVDDMLSVDLLVAECRDRLPHTLVREDDYARMPKPDGYRSVHLVYKYRGSGERAPFNNRRVELQIRTRLQHSWATAVEAVGLFRGEDLKSGEGSADWLRLFYLVSCEFAVLEGCAPMEQVGRRARIQEIRRLTDSLDALDLLENMRHAFNYVRTHVRPPELPRFYLIRFIRDNKQVEVSPFFAGDAGSKSLHQLEMEIEAQQRDEKVALVEVDRIEQLVSAYPNYFGDVALFLTNLRSLCGQDNIEFVLSAPQIVRRPKDEAPDISWLKVRHRLWEHPTVSQSRRKRS